MDVRDKSLIQEDVGGGVRLLRLNRPSSRNALSIALRDAVSDVVDESVRDTSVRVLVLTGTGQTFCAGFDLTEFQAAADDPGLHTRLWASSDRFHHTVWRCPIPIICALNGPAIAGGLDLATLCDLRIAHGGVWFSRPEVDFAVPLFEPLRDVVGSAKARELCLVARKVDADEALRIGLINHIVSPADLLDETVALARKIAVRPYETVRATKAKFTAATIAARPTLAL
jgi:enoyl-CoA hydratase/carnithine racemase